MYTKLDLYSNYYSCGIAISLEWIRLTGLQNSKKQLWETDVQSLIAKLSVSFRRFMNEIECDGEVNLDKGTLDAPLRDVCDYGILIKVFK